MANEDDLGSFFAEISEIEAQVQEESTATVVSQVVAAAAPQINKQSHVVYTYSDPTENTSSSSSSKAYSSDQPSLASFATQSHESSSSFASNIPLQNKKFVRAGGGEVWVDNTLNEWPENDFRIFVGDLGKEVTNESLGKAFQHYKSFAKAKVVKSKLENKGRGYGFVSFLDPMDCAKAIREMNGKYLGSRPMSIRKSTWKDRDMEEVSVSASLSIFLYNERMR
jgi:RNA recognition motif-containing protein